MIKERVGKFLKEFDITKLKSLDTKGYQFAYCENLTDVYIHKNVAEIGSAAPSPMACNDSIGILAADGDAGL